MDDCVSMGVVRSLCPPSQIWRVVVRVIRLWVTYSKNGSEEPKTVEMVLMDHYVSEQESVYSKMFGVYGYMYLEWVF